MLERSSNDPNNRASFGWKPNRTFFITFLGTLTAALLGSIQVLLLGGPRLEWSELWPGLVFGAVFGGWVGLISCLSFGLIRKIRDYGMRSFLRMVITFVVLGGVSGAPIFFPFGDGLTMALGLAVEAAVFGGVIGGVLGLLVFIITRTRG